MSISQRQIEVAQAILQEGGFCVREDLVLKAIEAAERAAWVPTEHRPRPPLGSAGPDVMILDICKAVPAGHPKAADIAIGYEMNYEESDRRPFQSGEWTRNPDFVRPMPLLPE